MISSPVISNILPRPGNAVIYRAAVYMNNTERPQFDRVQDSEIPGAGELYPPTQTRPFPARVARRDVPNDKRRTGARPTVCSIIFASR